MSTEPQIEAEQQQAVALIDALLDDLTSLARDKRTTPATFFTQVAEQLAAILEPLSANCWMLGPESALVEISRKAIPGWDLASNHLLAEKLLESQDSGKIVAEPILTSNGAVALVGSPIFLRDQYWGALSICLKEHLATASFASILAAIAEICADYLVQFEAARIGEANQTWEELFQFSLTAHHSLDLLETAYQVSNDARIFLNCDRVSIFGVSGTRPKLLAISSVAVIDHKTRTTRWMKSLVRVALRAGRPIFSHEENLSPNFAQQLEQFQQESGLEFMAIIPLRQARKNSRPLVGALVVEATDDARRIEIVRRLNQILPHASSAMANAVQYSSLPFRRLLSGLGWLLSAFRLRNIPQTLFAVLLLTAIVCALFMIKIDMRVRVDGELRPVEQRNVFAPMDCVVDEILVRHGDQVTKDQPLAKLSSPELELELKRISGELQIIEKQQEIKQISLNQVSTGNVGDQILVNQLASEIADLEQEHRSLSEQQRLLVTKRDRLEILSPINGEIVTWNAEQTLRERPLHRGDLLMKIADAAGDWNLAFEVPEHRVGYLLKQQQGLANTEQLQVEFFLQSDPSRTFTGKVLSFAHSTEIQYDSGPTVTMLCSVPKNEIETLRHGASVIGKVNCGKRSVGDVWTYELIDSLRRRFVW
jgi:multidrug efflux pump subunit AcrA (membrane-fusion protein)